jgi:hypothetical protein
MDTRFIRISVIIIALSGLSLMAGCSSTTWEDAEQEDT